MGTVRGSLAVAARIIFVTLLIGVLTGLGAAALVLTLHGVQYLAYGQHEGMNPMAIQGTTALQRAGAITIAGILGALLYCASQKYLPRIVSVEESVASSRPMPVWSTLISSFTQMMTAAAGGSIGRENAPREIGSMIASQLAPRLGIDIPTTRIIIAAASGAGLGAIYHIPLAGAVFAAEVLLMSFTPMAMMIVLACSAVSTITASFIVGTSRLYSTLPVETTWQALVAAVILGGICGVCGILFRRATQSAVHNAQAASAKVSILVSMPLAFLGVGLISIWLPNVLGNGRYASTFGISLADEGWAAFTPWVVAGLGVLFVAKAIAVWATLRSGAAGGTLTPGFTLGIVSGIFLGGAAALCMPESWLPSATACAMIGASGFLSTTLRAPLFAVIVTAEFTGQPADSFLPLFLASATAYAASLVVRRRTKQQALASHAVITDPEQRSV